MVKGFGFGALLGLASRLWGLIGFGFKAFFLKEPFSTADFGFRGLGVWVLLLRL